MFVGRVEEQRAINYLLDAPGYRGCVIYGRRRLGKTELIKYCLLGRKEKSIIYQCKESGEYENTLLLTRLIEQVFSQSHLTFSSFIDALAYIFEFACNEPVHLVIDEYPYIRESVAGCDSKLQELIDCYSNTSKVKLFLLGSSISTMEDVLISGSPLYGRFHQSILLKQMDYYDSSKFYPSFSNEDKVVLYSVFGGVPFYNAQIDEKQSVEANIIRLLSGSYSGLKDFLETYMKQELRKINNANIVFDVIAQQAFHYSDIMAKSNISPSSALTAILQKLIKMDLIDYVSPINDKNAKQKSGYVISDHCLRFYYHFIYRNSSAHSVLDDRVFYNKYIKPELETTYVPMMFEIICKEYLIRQNKKGLLEPMLTDIGTFWYDNPVDKKNGQFDIVGKCDDGYVFYECKYTNSAIDDHIINEEIQQVAKTNLKPVQYGFFSKNGYKLKKEYPYHFYRLDDLFD